MNLKKSGIQLDLVFWLVSQGFSVVPLHLGSKVPKIKWGRYQKVLPTRDELLRWFRVPSNGAVVTGTNSLVVIDFDNIHDYLRWSLWAQSDGPEAARLLLRDAYKVRTSRGIHVYSRSSMDIRNLHYGKIDIKGRGGLVTLPGSIHPSGILYREYQQGSFPVWAKLEDILPTEVLALGVQEVPEWRRREERERLDLSVLDEEQVLNMPVQVDLNEVKRAHRIEDYIEGIEMTGPNWGIAKCPFHEDKNPSFWIDTERQLCGCFSGCTAQPLDVINLVARLNGISNSDAIRELGMR